MIKILKLLMLLIVVPGCSGINKNLQHHDLRVNAIERYFNSIFLISSCEWPFNRLVVIDFCLKSRPYYDSKLQKVELHFIPVKKTTITNTENSEIKEILLREYENLQYELGLPDEDTGLLLQPPIFLAADYSELDKSIFKEILSVLNVKLEINAPGFTGMIEKSNSTDHIYTLDKHGILVH